MAQQYFDAANVLIENIERDQIEISAPEAAIMLATLRHDRTSCPSRSAIGGWRTAFLPFRKLFHVYF